MQVLAMLSHLKYSLWTNKPIENIAESGPDTAQWQADISLVKISTRMFQCTVIHLFQLWVDARSIWGIQHVFWGVVAV